METMRMTASGAVVRYMAAHRIGVDGQTVPLFAIFGDNQT